MSGQTASRYLLVAVFALALPAWGARPPHKPAAPSRGAPEPQNPGDYFIAVSYAMDGEEYDIAEKIAREGAAKYPAAVGFHVLIGDVLMAKRKVAEAFYEYEWELLRVGPDKPTGADAQDLIAQIMQSARGTDTDDLRVVIDAVKTQQTDPKKSVETLRRRMERANPPFVLRLLYAEALDAAGEPGEAAAIYRDLLKADPYFVPAYVELAAIVRKGGKAKDADALIDKAKQIDPDHWRLRSP